MSPGDIDCCPMSETWKAVPGYEGWYEASTLGRLRILKSPGRGGRGPYPFVLTNLLYRKGYYKQQFSSCGGTREPYRTFLHRIIFLTFHGPIPPGLTVNHIDGNKANNRPENLELATHRQQADHARRMGLRRDMNGKPHHLTPDDVREIRRAHCEDGETWEHLAARFDVVKGAIGHIIRGRTWKHVR